MPCKKAKRVGAGALARRLTAGVTRHGTTKRQPGSDQVIRSVGTERVTRAGIKLYIRWLRSKGKDWHEQTMDDVTDYLDYRATRVEQTTLDGDRLALSRVLREKIQYVVSCLPRDRPPRALQPIHVEALLLSAHEDLRLSIELCLRSGLRAMELLTLAPTNLLSEDTRPWHPMRFHGRDNYRYFTVVGKGQLKRLVAVPPEIADRLDAKRLVRPERFTDRECHGIRYFDLVGGHEASYRFSKLSLETLGFSTGLHGLRHTFSQTRVVELQLAGVAWKEAVRALSCELGHFSTANTMTYLR